MNCLCQFAATVVQSSWKYCIHNSQLLALPATFTLLACGYEASVAFYRHIWSSINVPIIIIIIIDATHKHYTA